MSLRCLTPKPALACNKSVSKHGLERSCSEVLDVMLGIRNQDLFYEIRSAGQEHPPRTNTEARKRTIVAGRVEQEVEQSGAELADIAAK